MQDKILITKAQLSQAREISKNIKDTKVEAFIRESQLIELRRLLGDALYIAMLADWDEINRTFTEQRFTDLFFGVDYQSKGEAVRFYGLEPFLVYTTYNRTITQQQANVSRYGMKHLTDEASEDMSAAEVRGRAKDTVSIALEYEEGALNFLDEKKSDYPEYKDTSNPHAPSSTALKFFKV